MDECQTRIPKHLYSLDALRGLAALTVVFWHWQHFFLAPSKSDQVDAALLPLFPLFEPFYVDGWRAVDLFFCLSGFIFFWLYSEKIAGRQISPRNFAALRLSRLYPLHFVTLLAVAVGQKFFFSKTGAFFIYPNNDRYHFLLQLPFASNWGFEKGSSFNGPIWSLSVEILLYAIFFAVCFCNWRRWWQLAFYTLCGFLLIESGFPSVGRGLFSFFIGGISFQCFTLILANVPIRTALAVVTGVASLMWFVVPFNAHHNLVYRLYKHFGGIECLRFHEHDLAGYLLERMTMHSFDAFLFPLTIVTLGLWEVHRGTLGRRLAPVGHISYSSYLLHFPLQLACCTILTSVSERQALFSKPYSLVVFFVVLIFLSLCSYHFFELPCQSFIRKRLVQNRSAAPPVFGE